MTVTKESLREALLCRDCGVAIFGHGEPIGAAARFVERLLPEKCPHGKTESHTVEVHKNPWPEICTGQLWDEGLVEAVAKAIYDILWGPSAWDDDKPAGAILDNARDRARAVLAALTQEVGK